MANLGIALGAGVDEYNNQRRMTMAEDEASRQKEQFGWAKTAQDQRQAVKAAQAKVLSDAATIRQQYAADPLAGAQALSGLHSDSKWDGKATSKVSKGLDGKIYASRYTGEGPEGSVEQYEVTPKFFEQALDDQIAYRMAEADPDNYLRNRADIKKTEQGARHMSILEQGNKNYLDVTSADRGARVDTADKDRNSADKRHTETIGVQRAGLGIQRQGLNLQKQHYDIEEKRLGAQNARALDDRNYERAKDASKVVDDAVQTYAQVAGPEKAKEYAAGVGRYLALHFNPGKGDDAKAKAYQGIREYDLEMALNEKGQHLLTSEKPWDGVTRSMWVHDTSKIGDAGRYVFGDHRFRNVQTGQVVDMGDINKLSPDQQVAFLGGYTKGGDKIPGRVVDSSGKTVFMPDVLKDKSPVKAEAVAERSGEKRRTLGDGFKAASGEASKMFQRSGTEPENSGPYGKGFQSLLDTSADKNTMGQGLRVRMPGNYNN